MIPPHPAIFTRVAEKRVAVLERRTGQPLAGILGYFVKGGSLA